MDGTRGSGKGWGGSESPSAEKTSSDSVVEEIGPADGAVKPKCVRHVDIGPVMSSLRLWRCRCTACGVPALSNNQLVSHSLSVYGYLFSVDVCVCMITLREACSSVQSSTVHLTTQLNLPGWPPLWCGGSISWAVNCGRCIRALLFSYVDLDHFVHLFH